MMSFGGHNGICIVFDSCRYDSFMDAKTPFLDSLAVAKEAMAWSPYTPASHTAMFCGHLPTVIEKPYKAFETEPLGQLWRIKTGPSRDQRKQFGILFQGANIIDGYRQMGFWVLGAGGVSQFSEGSHLRTAYPWSNFLYVGPNLDEEPLSPRDKSSFPLEHIDDIVEQLSQHEHWFLFVNCQATHYPYDIGEGIEKDIVESCFPLLKQSLNWKSLTVDEKVLEALVPFSKRLHDMQKKAVEYLDTRLELLFTQLAKITKQPIYFVVTSDHGECFGERHFQRPVFGHLFSVPETLQVPFLFGELGVV